MVPVGNRNLHVRIMIVSSNNFVRMGLRRIFEGVLGIVVVGESHGGVPARDLVKQERPDLIVVDLESDVNPVEAINIFRQSAPLSRIILLTGWDDMDRARQGLVAGAEAIMMKCQPPSVLLSIIESAAKSLAASPSTKPSPVLTHEKVVKPLIEKAVPRSTPWTGSLTDRERAVVSLISQGLSNRSIGDRLFISEITVRHHLTSIFDKLGVSNRQKLLLLAHKCGLMELTALAQEEQISSDRLFQK